MNTQHTLMMLAASVGSLCMAQTPSSAPMPSAATPPAAVTQAAEPSPLAALIAEVSTPAPALIRTPEQRLASLPDLALMPQEVDSFVVLPDIAALERRFCTSDKKCPVKSLAIGYSKGAEQMAGTIGELVALFLNARMLLRAEVGWEASAGTPEIQRSMHESFVAYRKAMIKRISRELRTQENGPIYAVATLKPEAKLELMGLKPLLLGICAAHPEEFQYIEQGELFGIRHTPQSDIGPVPKVIAGSAPELAGEKEELEKDMKALPMTVMFFHAGDQLLATACSSPEQVRVAGSIADSLLNTDKVAALDNRLESGLVLGAHLSPSMQQALSKMGFAGTQYLLGVTHAVFSKLAEQPGDFQDVFAQAAQGAQTLHPLTRWGLPGVFRNPADLAIWMDDHLHLEFTHDADELTFEPAALTLTGLGSMQQQAIYFESSPSRAKETADCQQNLRALEDILRGYVCTGSPGQAAFTLSLYEALSARFQPVGQSLRDMKKTLESNFSMVVSSGETPESLLPLMGPIMPVVAYRVGIRDQGQFRQAWEKVQAGTQSFLAGMLPPDAMVLPKLAENKCPMGGVSLTLDLPGSNTAFSPGMVVTDTCLVLGSSAAMNCLVSQQQGKAPVFSGMVFALHFEPMARMAQSLAGQMEKNIRHHFPTPPQPVVMTQVMELDAEPAANPESGATKGLPSAQSANQKPDNEASDKMLIVEQSDNAPLIQRYCGEIERLMAIRRQAAALETLSRNCRGIYGANQVKDGKATLRVDALLMAPQR